MSQTVAIFGGSFDPPHVGHVLAISYVLTTESVETVLVIPAYRHPFDKVLSPFEHRVRMCELATQDLKRTHISTLESKLGTPSLTLRTLEHLASEHPDWRLRLVVGADVLREAPKWHAFEQVRALAPLIVLGRGGVEEPNAPETVLPTVSSTEVRAALRERRMSRLSRLVPRAVLEYIEAHALYR